MESKTIFLSSLDVERYKKATHYRGNSWPSSFLLTLWQRFEVAELTEVAHYLVEQKIELFQPIQLEEVCQCHLVRVAVIPKTKGEIWIYRLEIEQDGLGAVCETKIYVRQSDEDI